MIESIAHFVITVADLEATLSFYETVLGFRRVTEARRPTALVFGTQKINVHAASPYTFEPIGAASDPGAADVLAVVAAGPLDNIIARLGAHGVAHRARACRAQPAPGGQ